MFMFLFSKETTDGVTLLNKDPETLLRAIMQFMQISSDETAQQAAEEERYGFITSVVIKHVCLQTQQLQLCLKYCKTNPKQLQLTTYSLLEP